MPDAFFILFPLTSSFGPGNGQLFYNATLIGGNEQVQGFENYPPLQFSMEGNSKMMPHHEWNKDGPRRFYLLRDIFGDADRNCGNSPFFYGALDQRDRLVTDRSGGREQRNI